jgi:hypothetical protein
MTISHMNVSSGGVTERLIGGLAELKPGRESPTPVGVPAGAHAVPAGTPMRKVPPPFGQVTGRKPGVGDGWH